jgi:hypothetical protein
MEDVRCPHSHVPGEVNNQRVSNGRGKHIMSWEQRAGGGAATLRNIAGRQAGRQAGTRTRLGCCYYGAVLPDSQHETSPSAPCWRCSLACSGRGRHGAGHVRTWRLGHDGGGTCRRQAMTVSCPAGRPGSRPRREGRPRRADRPRRGLASSTCSSNRDASPPLKTD